MFPTKGGFVRFSVHNWFLINQNNNPFFILGDISKIEHVTICCAWKYLLCYEFK